MVETEDLAEEKEVPPPPSVILSLDVLMKFILYVFIYCFVFFRMWKTWDFMEETEDLAEEKEARQADRTVAPTPYWILSSAIASRASWGVGVEEVVCDWKMVTLKRCGDRDEGAADMWGLGLGFVS